MQLPHFYAKRQFFPCYGVIPGATSWSFFGLRHFHWYVWATLGLKGKDVHLNWRNVLQPGFVFFLFIVFQKKQMDTSAKVAVVISTHYGVISQHYGVISWNHGRIHFPLFFAAHRLAESMEKRSFALSRARVLGPPLCQSSVCMVSHSSTALTTIDLWQPHFWMSCCQNFRATSKKKRRLGIRHFFCTQTPI